MSKGKAVILVGGHSKGTRFRPLSLDLPKPLFPVAGVPMIYHQIEACKTVEGLTEILLLGFYKPQEFQEFIEKTSQELGVRIEYLQEEKESGTGGGMYAFKDRILQDDPSFIFLISSDICCNFPLKEMLEFHFTLGSRNPLGTLLATKAPSEQAMSVGCFVKDDATNRLLHCVEKPETFVSDLINCGVYCFSPDIFAHLRNATQKLRSRSRENVLDVSGNIPNNEYIGLERHVIVPLAGSAEFYVYETKSFWRQLKTAGSLVYCNELYMRHVLPKTHPELLTPKAHNVIPPVMIHPSAKVDPTAVLGPNVYIGANAVVGRGVRIANSVVMDGCQIGERALIKWAVLGWKVTIGCWTRIEGFPNPILSLMDSNSGYNPRDRKGICIFGTGASASNEIMVANSIVMPHKELSASFENEILL